jgi:hypothetical protein
MFSYAVTLLSLLTAVNKKLQQPRKGHHHEPLTTHPTGR